jgi:hypothetical protein
VIFFAEYPRESVLNPFKMFLTLLRSPKYCTIPNNKAIINETFGAKG